MVEVLRTSADPKKESSPLRRRDSKESIRSNGSTRVARRNKGVSRYLNWYFELSDSHFTKEFEEFNQERGLTKFFILLVIFMSFVMLPSSLNEMIHFSSLIHDRSPIQRENTERESFLLLSFLFSLFGCVLCLVSIVCGFSIIRQTIPEHFQHVETLLRTYLHRVFCFWRHFVPNEKSLTISFHAASLPRTCAETNSMFSAQRIEISVMREVSGRSSVSHQGISIHSHHTNASTRRVAPDTTIATDFLALAPQVSLTVPNSSLKLAGSVTSSSGKSKITPQPEIVENQTAENAPASETSIPQRLIRLKLAFLMFTQAYFMLLFVQHGISRRCPDSQMNRMIHSVPLDEAVVSVYQVLEITECHLRGVYVSIHAIFLFSLSYLLWFALPELFISTIWGSLVAALTVLIAMALYLDTPRALNLISVSRIFIITITIDMQIHEVQMFLTTRKLGDILAENERITLQSRAQEMRNMIGNVAHDLKTVSIACSPSSLILTSFPFLCSR
jgi:hypothetical protein